MALQIVRDILRSFVFPPFVFGFGFLRRPLTFRDHYPRNLIVDRRCSLTHSLSQSHIPGAGNYEAKVVDLLLIWNNHQSLRLLRCHTRDTARRDTFRRRGYF